MSWTGQCIDCANARLAENITAMHYHRGENFTRWRQGMAASVGAVLADE